MTTNQIRDALRAVRDAAEVPAIDQVAFRAEVRAARRRRTAGRALVGIAAAGVLVAGGLGITAVVDDTPAPKPADTSPEAWDGVLTFVEHDGRLAALDDDGSLEDLGPGVERFLGAPGSWMYVVDGGELDVRWAVPPYDDLASPVEGPVESAALSRDGSFLAWLDADARVHRYDIDAEREDLTLQVADGAEVLDVSEAGVLVAESGTLSVRGEQRDVAVPGSGDGSAGDAQLAGDLVLVNGSNGASVLYDVSGGAAEVVDSFHGPGELSFLGDVALLRPHGVELRGARTRTTTFEGVTTSDLQFAGPTRLVVSGHDASGAPVIHSCRIDLECTRLAVDGEVTLLE